MSQVEKMLFFIVFHNINSKYKLRMLVYVRNCERHKMIFETIKEVKKLRQLDSDNLPRPFVLEPFMASWPQNFFVFCKKRWQAGRKAK